MSALTLSGASGRVTGLEPLPHQTNTMVVNLGPQHPATHGVLQIVLGIDGERVTSATPHIGFLHRNHEKIEESRSYEQVIPYLDRMDYVSGLQNELAYVLAVESLSGIDVPDRAKYIRTALFELNRVISHLVWLGTYLLDLGAITPFLYAFRDREKALDIIERTCGARMLPNYFTFGGLRRDIHPQFWHDLVDFCAYFENILPEYEALTIEAPVFKARTQGVGLMSKELAINHGISGPNLRASGVNHDLRKDQPYDAYPYLEFEVISRDEGDAWARSKVRFDEFYQSLNLIRQCAYKAPRTGAIKGKGRVKIDEGQQIYRSVEGSRGQLGVYLMSDGGAGPYRIKHRSPSFVVLQTIPDLFIGQKFADVIAILGSVDVVLGEVDR
ncbi:MAG: NADH-quinone oxidoreductase subunit D [Deinococcales bacterium]